MSKSFYIQEKSGKYKFSRKVSQSEIISLATTILKSRIVTTDCFTSSKQVEKYLRCALANFEREVFHCMFLNQRHYLIKAETLFYGTVGGAHVHPREVARRALQLNASAIICGHNHPTGIVEPSEADKSLTKRISEALDLFGIRLLDHIIVGNYESCSFSDLGLI